MRAKIALCAGLVMFALTPGAIPSSAADGAPVPVPAGSRAGFRDVSPFKGMSWTALGPKAAGGRIEAIDCLPGSPGTIYVGAGSGGVWKTVNGGMTWTPLFDRGPTMAVGDLAISPSDPDVVWVGTGESLMARSSFAGEGVFRSTDGGRTWESRGLEDTHHIGRIVIDPRDPDRVFVAAIGHQYTFNEERGVFMTADGGASWTRLKEGLPAGPLIGRIGLDVCPAAPGVVYAAIDNLTPVPARPGRKANSVPAGGEIYRSDDRGDTWRKVNEGDLAAGTGYAFGDIRVSPKDPSVVYVLGVGLIRSADGGRTFTRIDGPVVRLSPLPTRALHLDQHELWIDPRDPDRLVLGNDGGLFVSNDGGRAWLHLNNLPITEFYAAFAGSGSPYPIYGGTQDNAALRGRSDRRLDDAALDGWSHLWIDLWGGGDSFFTFPDPEDPDVVYYEQQFGDLKRKDTRTGRTVSIRPRPDKGRTPDRFNWMTPFIISGHDPATLYCGAQRLFRSGDRGEHWTVLSPDLTTAAGPDRQGDVPFGTITTIAESPLAKGLLFAGTDDGNVWMTADDGVSWDPISAGLPRKWVSRLEASPHDADRVYAALTGYREDDFRTYLFRSGDRGRTWESISQGLPPESVNVIREDPERPGLLYIGTDQGGVHASADDGATWSSLCADLPPAAVHDLAVQQDEDELVAATHGRGVFTLDIAPVRETAGAPAGDNRLFASKPARRPTARDYRGDWVWETARPAVLHFYLRRPGRTTITILDEKDRTVRTIERETLAGINAVSWDLVPDGPPGPPEVYPAARDVAKAGRYRVVVRSGEAALSGSFEVLEADGVPATGKASIPD